MAWASSTDQLWESKYCENSSPLSAHSIRASSTLPAGRSGAISGCGGEIAGGGGETRVRRPSRDRHPHTGGTGLLRPKQNRGGRWFLGGLLSRTSTPNGTDLLPLQRVFPYLLVRLQQVTLWFILFIGDHQGTEGVQSINMGGRWYFGGRVGTLTGPFALPSSSSPWCYAENSESPKQRPKP